MLCTTRRAFNSFWTEGSKVIHFKVLGETFSSCAIYSILFRKSLRRSCRMQILRSNIRDRKNEGTKQAAMCPLMGVFQIDLSLSNLNLMICHQLLTAHGSNLANPVRGNMKMRAKYHTIRRLNINTKCMENTNRLKRPSPTRRDMQNGSVDLQ